MNNPLHTILKINKFSNLTNKSSNYINKFKNNEQYNFLKRQHYYLVFMEITRYFEKSKFYDKVFLPRMDKRTKFMRMNRKFTPLTREEFEEQKEILKINNTYDEYSHRQDIPLFTYITNDPDQFENWSAIRIFEWWHRLRMSGIPKREWDVFDAVKYLFINQFMRIMNSYLKYGIDIIYYRAFNELKEYLRLVDVFYESGGQYQHLLNAHLAFCEWFFNRFNQGLLFESGRSNELKYVSSNSYTNNKKKDYKIKIIKFFNKTLEDNVFILVIPLSFFQKESKFINIYTAPLIVFLGINYRTHYINNDFYELYSPYGQIYHDFDIHGEILIDNYSLLYKNVNISDILLFEKRCKFLTIVSLINNDEFKKLLWFILHEIPTFFFDTHISLINFFDINILLNLLIEKKGLYEYKYTDGSIYTLICACIIFFMFQSFSLNGISKISIQINQYITTVSLNDTQLVILEIISMSKQVRIIYLNKDVINQKIIRNFSYIIKEFGWIIVDSQQNTQKQINMYKKQIGNLYKKMLELQQPQP